MSQERLTSGSTPPSESASPASRAKRRAKTSMSSRAKDSRATLCARPERFARRLALSTSARVSVTSRFHTRSTWSLSGSLASARTASLTIFAHAGRPLIRATASSSPPRAFTPGTRSPSVTETTPVSPSDGRTCSM